MLEERCGREQSVEIVRRIVFSPFDRVEDLESLEFHVREHSLQSHTRHDRAIKRHRRPFFVKNVKTITATKFGPRKIGGTVKYFFPLSFSFVRTPYVRFPMRPIGLSGFGKVLDWW